MNTPQPYKTGIQKHFVRFLYLLQQNIGLLKCFFKGKLRDFLFFGKGYYGHNPGGSV